MSTLALASWTRCSKSQTPSLVDSMYSQASVTGEEERVITERALFGYLSHRIIQYCDSV